MRMKIYILIGVIIMSSCTNMKPPIAEKKSHNIVTHGHSREDNYYWMRLTDEQKSSNAFDEQTKKVVNYIDDENEFTKNNLEKTEVLQEKLFNEITGRIKKDDQSVPYLKNGYFYYHRYEKGKEYAIHFRKKNSINSEEEIILDENELAYDKDYFELGGKYISPDNQWLAFSTDTLGRRFYRIYIKNLVTGKILDHFISNTEGDVAWANDNETIYYTTKNKITLLSDNIYRHNIHTDSKKDILVYKEEDNEFYIGVYRSKSGKYIIIWNSSTLVSDYHILRSDNPGGKFVNFTPRKAHHEYSIEHQNNKFYIITNWEAKNNRLMTVSDEMTSIEKWEEIIPQREDVHLMDIDVFKNHLVLNERIDGISKLRVISQHKNLDRYIDFDQEVYTTYISVNEDYNSNKLRFVFNSLVYPKTTYDYDMESDQKILLKMQDVLGSYDPQNYTSKRINVIARDGNIIPVSIAYKKSLRSQLPQNLLLYGYGSYGSTEDPYFSNVIPSLLDRGFIYAIAHVRGSQINGRKTYDDGKLFNKMNTFNDFIDVGRYLIENQYTDEEHLFCSGGSAGGLLIGAVINIEPTMWKGAIARVPFVDVVTTMLDPTIPLTSNEWDEWGDPREKNYYDYMLSYSPYDQIKFVEYPNLFVTAGFFDSQVQYWEPLKWVAKLRDHWKGANKLLLYTNMDAGHGGDSGRFKRYREYAMQYAFLLDIAEITS